MDSTESNSPSNSMEDTDTFLQKFQKWYEPNYHLPLLATTCGIGIIANALNVVVLTRKRMRSPANVILCSMNIVMLFHIILLLFNLVIDHLNTDSSPFPNTSTYLNMMMRLICYNLASVMHIAILMHSAVLAMLRYVAVRFPMMIAVHSIKKAVISLMATYALTVGLIIPSFLCSSVVEKEWQFEYENETYFVNAYTIEISTLANEHAILRDFYWYIGTGARLLPCFLLIVVACLTHGKMKHVVAKRQLMCTGVNSRRNLIKMRRSTKQLPIVVAIIVAVEVPQAVLTMVTFFLGRDFLEKVSMPLFGPFELLTMMYHSVTFAIYCAMNSQFRNTLALLFKQAIRRRRYNLEMQYSLRISEERSTNDRRTSQGISKATSEIIPSSALIIKQAAITKYRYNRAGKDPARVSIEWPKVLIEQRASLSSQKFEEN